MLNELSNNVQYIKAFNSYKVQNRGSQLQNNIKTMNLYNYSHLRDFINIKPFLGAGMVRMLFLY